MNPTELRCVRTGVWIGALFGLVGASEMLAENSRTINPASGAFGVSMWLVAATSLGAVCGWLGGRGLSLFRLAPGVRIDLHAHPGGEEVFVLDGALEDEHASYPKGCWVRCPPGRSWA